MFFHYLQLQHALSTQFQDSIPILKVILLLDIILGQDPKKQISQIYSYLMLPTATAIAYKLNSCWEPDLGVMTDEDWEEALVTCKYVSPKHLIASPTSTYSLGQT